MRMKKGNAKEWEDVGPGGGISSIHRNDDGEPYDEPDPEPSLAAMTASAPAEVAPTYTYREVPDVG